MDDAHRSQLWLQWMVSLLGLDLSGHVGDEAFDISKQLLVLVDDSLDLVGRHELRLDLDFVDLRVFELADEGFVDFNLGEGRHGLIGETYKVSDKTTVIGRRPSSLTTEGEQWSSQVETITFCSCLYLS